MPGLFFRDGGVFCHGVGLIKGTTISVSAPGASGALAATVSVGEPELAKALGVMGDWPSLRTLTRSSAPSRRSHLPAAGLRLTDSLWPPAGKVALMPVSAGAAVTPPLVLICLASAVAPGPRMKPLTGAVRMEPGSTGAFSPVEPLASMESMWKVTGSVLTSPVKKRTCTTALGSKVAESFL